VLIALVSSLLGVFSAALEAAVSEIGEARLRAFADEGGPVAKVAKRVLDDDAALRARLLAGRVIGLTAAAAVTAAVAIEYGGVIASIGFAALVALFYSMLVALATSLARRSAGAWALRVLGWFRPIELLMIPFAYPLILIERVIDRRVPEALDEDPKRITELGLEEVIEKGRADGGLDAEQADLLYSVLEFRDTVAHEVMVPRTKVVAVEVETPLSEVIALLVQKGHSRYPVYREKLDRIVGVLVAKDLYAIINSGRPLDDISLADVIRQRVFFAAETQKIGQLLREMQARRMHLAVVVDEFGGTSGIVTLEDIVEEIVGEIQDEYDREQSQVLELGAGAYLVDAGISVYDLEERIGGRLRTADESESASLGGLVVEKAGHVPAIGDSLDVGEFRITVKDSDARHVRRVEVRRQAPAPAS
jgi:CBS domain containing-hemolysin-like protein